MDPSASDVGCWQWVFGWKVGLTALLPADCKIYIWTVEQLARWGRMDRSDRQQERKSIIAVRYWWKALWGSLSQCELLWSDLSCLGRETGHERGSEQRRGCVAVKLTEVNFYQIVPSGIQDKYCSFNVIMLFFFLSGLVSIYFSFYSYRKDFKRPFQNKIGGEKKKLHLWFLRFWQAEKYKVTVACPFLNLALFLVCWEVHCVSM